MVISVKKEKKPKPQTFCPTQPKVDTGFCKFDFEKLHREMNGKSSSHGSGHGVLVGI